MAGNNKPRRTLVILVAVGVVVVLGLIVWNAIDSMRSRLQEEPAASATGQARPTFSVDLAAVVDLLEKRAVDILTRKLGRPSSLPDLPSPESAAWLELVEELVQDREVSLQVGTYISETQGHDATITETGERKRQFIDQTLRDMVQ